MTRLYQVHQFKQGIGQSVEKSITPASNQRIVIDYLWYYFYAAHADDMAQVDTSADQYLERKTILYFAPTAAVHYAPIATMLKLPLNPGEDFTVFVKGAAATSMIDVCLMYHIENVSDAEMAGYACPKSLSDIMCEVMAKVY